MNKEVNKFIKELKDIPVLDFKGMSDKEKSDIKRQAQSLKANPLFKLLLAKLLDDYKTRVLTEDRDDLKGRIRGLNDLKNWIDSLGR